MNNSIPLPRADLIRGVLALLALIALVFAQTWTFEFVSWDDQMYVTGSPQVLAGLSYDGVKWAFETRYSSLYTPLAWISHMADVSLWGLNAGGHHLSSVLFHTMSTLVLFALLAQTTGETWRAFLVSALFAIHPLHVESVAWVAERKDVLVAFFFLATLYSHAMWARERKTLWRVLTYLMAMLAGFSKPMAVTLPVAMVLIDFWPLNRFDFHANPRQALLAAVKEKWLFFVGAAALAVQTLSFGQDPNLPPVNYQWLGLLDRLQVAGAAYGFYLWKTVWPSALSFFYPYRPPLPIWEFLLPPLILCGLLLVAWRQRSRFPVLWFGIAWYCVTLLPASGIVQIGWYIYADRYSYLPLIGIFAGLVWAVPFSAATSAGRSGAMAARLVATVLLLAATVLAYLQVGAWRDSQSLYSQAIASDPTNRMARLALAHQYVAKQQFDLATVHLDILLQRPIDDPLTAQGLLLRGDVFKFQGRGEQARMAWEAAAAADRTYWRARLRLGTHALELGDTAGAISNFLAADRLLHNNDEILNNLGVAYARAGDLRQALQAYDRAVRANWLNQTARLNLALTYEKMGASAQARDQYSALLTLNPKNAGAAEGVARLNRTARQ
jgi:tetratricopeptide (TPR) repeat protein